MISCATTPRERRIVSALDRIAIDVARADLQAPVLFIIGHVVSLYGDHAMDEFAREILADAHA
jgi:uroporphyrin-III C-methyltransferase